MIDSRFVYVAMALAALGAYGYVRATLRGVIAPSRVTWSLWGLEGLLAFGVETQQHVGPAALMTLMLGLVPCVVVLASFYNPRSVWRVSAFDLWCGAISLTGLLVWALVHEPTLALVTFIGADQVAALPTLRKSWLAPTTESAGVFILGSVNCAIALFTLKTFTTAGVLFPGCILVSDFVMALLIVSHVGPRYRAATVRATSRRETLAAHHQAPSPSWRDVQ